ncbi:hypothetical protein M9Y10_004144 [Tritrichomonas musculus]|uniref:Uncharacterized protein n=1 Tax=Tritrichomonas musculus TaxID=1915356 RepID=A0ABR2JRH1_9EUKA
MRYNNTTSSWTSPSPIPHITTNLNDMPNDPEDNDTIEFPIYTSQGDIKAIMTVAKYQNILSIAVSMFISLMIKIYLLSVISNLERVHYQKDTTSSHIINITHP